ncbi:GAF domain-containing protein [Colwellia chukchiensis]|uniref:GAF domain-containing protein n=1 Tax=Colwellia chukchiensis TaxID=641665 RepID=A0A1H7JBI5_9GAMM|nr:FHA domain-containing protein [Colwellia chukchiensis]SEK71722.1 GAF domain-containing protein [Colwellia chukchiensis]
MPARITVCYPNQPAVESFLYEGSGYRIGRANECELLLDHPTVSRQHAKVAHTNDIWQLEDQRSRNGTKVNGIAITQSTLKTDALISVGELDCLFETKSVAQLDAIHSHNQWRLSNSKSMSALPMSEHLQQNLSAQLQNIIMLTGTQRGIILLGDTLSTLQVSIAHGMQLQDFKLAKFEGSVGAISQCFQSGQAVIAMDISQHERLSARKSIELKKISALACIPLFYENSVVGVVYTDSKLSDKVLTELDIEILSTMSQQIQASVQAILLQKSIDSLQGILDQNTKQLTGIIDYNLLNLCH